MPLFRFACVAAMFSIAAACGSEAPSDGESTSSSTSGPPEPIPCNVDQLCPDPEQVCLVDQCSAGGIPTLEIVSPENEGLANWTPGGATTMLSVTIEVENFQIVDPAIDPTSVRGAGQVVLTLDGVEVMTIQEGDAAAGVTVMVPADATPGGHRLAAHLVLSDGTPYDNEEASKRRFFWFDDGTPRVSIMSPWPNDEFTTGEQPVETRVAVVNFELQPATVDPVPGAVGIVHTFINADFPTCGQDPECAADYTTVIAPPNPNSWALAAVLIPSAQVDASTNLIVQLARTDHVPYCGSVGPEDCDAIWESIPLKRIAPTD